MSIDTMTDLALQRLQGIKTPPTTRDGINGLAEKAVIREAMQSAKTRPPTAQDTTQFSADISVAKDNVARAIVCIGEDARKANVSLKSEFDLWELNGKIGFKVAAYGTDAQCDAFKKALEQDPRW